MRNWGRQWEISRRVINRSLPAPQPRPTRPSWPCVMCHFLLWHHCKGSAGEIGPERVSCFWQWASTWNGGGDKQLKAFCKPRLLWLSNCLLPSPCVSLNIGVSANRAATFFRATKWVKCYFGRRLNSNSDCIDASSHHQGWTGHRADGAIIIKKERFHYLFLGTGPRRYYGHSTPPIGLFFGRWLSSANDISQRSAHHHIL